MKYLVSGIARHLQMKVLLSDENLARAELQVNWAAVNDQIRVASSRPAPACPEERNWPRAEGKPVPPRGGAWRERQPARSASPPSHRGVADQTRRLPPAARLQTSPRSLHPRSFDGQVGPPVEPGEMTVQEQAPGRNFCRSSLACAGEALHPRPVGLQRPAQAPSEIAIVDAGPTASRDGYPVNIVCAQLPQEQLHRMKPTGSVGS